MTLSSSSRESWNMTDGRPRRRFPPSARRGGALVSGVARARKARFVPEGRLSRPAAAPGRGAAAGNKSVSARERFFPTHAVASRPPSHSSARARVVVAALASRAFSETLRSSREPAAARVFPSVVVAASSRPSFPARLERSIIHSTRTMGGGGESTRRKGSSPKYDKTMNERATEPFTNSWGEKPRFGWEAPGGIDRAGDGPEAHVLFAPERVHEAACKGFLDEVIWLLDKAPEDGGRVGVDHLDPGGRTPLHFACGWGARGHRSRAHRPRRDARGERHVEESARGLGAAGAARSRG